jgi:DUF4097 and DUF4098 domain-containing protein YvlB
MPYRGRRRSLAGPLVLIIIGVLFLLGNIHVVPWPNIGHLFARYWPLLLILWGVVRLLEHYSDRQHGYPTRGIGAGGVLFLIFLIMIGLAASSADRLNWQGIRADVDTDNDFFGIFGQNYSYTTTLTQDLPPAVNNGTVRVVSDRGDVTLNSWNQNQIKVDVTKKVRAQNQNEADQRNQQTQPTISIDGNVVTVNANTSAAGNGSVRSNLEIWVPQAMAADLATRYGDVSLTDRKGYVRASTSHGDITLSGITGNVDIEERRGDVRAEKITGDVTVNGRVNDIAISDVNGAVRLNGDYFGDMNLSKIAKGVTFRSSRTDMELAKLDGDLTMQSGDLRASNLAGPMKILTRSKDIHIDGISGDLRVENSNGLVEVRSTKLGAMDIANRKGDVQIVVPDKSAFQLQCKARNGDINSDFSGIKVTTERDDTTASGAVGTGGPTLQVNNEYGNIEIRKAGQS